MSSEKEKILSNDDIEQMETNSTKNKLFEEKRKKYILKGLSSLLSSIIKIL